MLLEIHDSNKILYNNIVKIFNNKYYYKILFMFL